PPATWCATDWSATSSMPTGAGRSDPGAAETPATARPRGTTHDDRDPQRDHRGRRREGVRRTLALRLRGDAPASGHRDVDPVRRRGGDGEAARAVAGPARPHRRDELPDGRADPRHAAA